MKPGDKVIEAHTRVKGEVLSVHPTHAVIKFESGTWMVRRSNWKLYTVLTSEENKE